MYNQIAKLTVVLAAGVCSSAMGQGCPPLKHLGLTSPYGFRRHPLTGKYAWHQGVDLHAKHDTVFAVMPGIVEKIGIGHLAGLFIIIDHGSIKSTYGHLSQLLVFPGDTVACGDAIAITGTTGQVTGEHLHFGIRMNGNPVDPLKYLYELFNN